MLSQLDLEQRPLLGLRYRFRKLLHSGLASQLVRIHHTPGSQAWDSQAHSLRSCEKVRLQICILPLAIATALLGLGPSQCAWNRCKTQVEAGDTVANGERVAVKIASTMSGALCLKARPP